MTNRYSASGGGAPFGVQSQNMYGGQNLPFFKLLQIKSTTLLQKLDYIETVENLLKIMLMVIVKTDTMVLNE